MSEFLERIRALIRAGDVPISDHGYDELAEDQLTAREVVAEVQEAVVVEEYPHYPKGPSALLSQKNQAGEPIHVVWGIPRGHDKPAVLVTAYRPDPEQLGLAESTSSARSRISNPYEPSGHPSPGR